MDCAKDLWKDKKGSSWKAHQDKEVLEKDKDQGLKWLKKKRKRKRRNQKFYLKESTMFLSEKSSRKRLNMSEQKKQLRH